MPVTIGSPLMLFIIASLCEIGSGLPVWPWWRTGGAAILGLLGAALLVTYGGVVSTYEPAHFGRVFAAYRGVFVVVSVFCGAGGSIASLPFGSISWEASSAWRVSW